MSLMALDIGNTRLKWMLFDGLTPRARPIAQGAVFLDHIDRLADTDWANLPPPQHLMGCIVAGEAVKRRVMQQLEGWDAPMHWVHASDKAAGVTNGYDHPIRLGADRWVAMIGARQRLLQHCQASGDAPSPLVVVMVGTAVTVDALDAQGQFLGGVILPGHGIMLKALLSGTAGLHVPTGDVKSFPTNTSDALTSGGTFAISGAIEHMRRNLAQHTGQAPRCVLSGGAGWKIAPFLSDRAELVDSLIFDGLFTLALERWGAVAKVILD